MHWMMTLAQVNPLSNETIETLAHTRSDTLALLALLGMIFLGVIIARIVGRGIDRQNDALDNEHKEKHAIQEENKELLMRVDQLDRRLTEVISEHKLKALEASKDHEILMTRLNIAEAQVLKLTEDLKEERRASMVVLAENERLRTENGSLKNRIEELERRIADLEKRQTDTHNAANSTPESKIETSELAEAQTRILSDVQKSLQDSN